MGKDTYRLISVVDAGCINLGLDSGFEKKKDDYLKLEQKLERDWGRRNEDGGRKRCFDIGNHVLAKIVSGDLRGYKRGIVRAVIRGCQYDNEYLYDVFLYDYGMLEQLSEANVAGLDLERQYAEMPRTVTVNLVGVYPCRVVMDLAKKAMGSSHSCVTRTSEWSNRTSKLVNEWLCDDGVQHIRLDVRKTNNNGTVYGDIFRVTQSATESLIGMLVEKNLALRDEHLLNSQLSPSLEPLSEENLVRKRSPRGEAKQSQRKPSGEKAVTNVTINEKTENLAPDLTSYTDLQHLSSDSSKLKGKEVKLVRRIDGIPGRLLIRGDRVRKPYTTTEEFRLPSHIQKALTSIGGSELSDLQKYVAPQIVHGSDVVIISPGGSRSQNGKSIRAFSYLLPIIRLVCEGLEDPAQKSAFQGKASYPEVIIVCKTPATGTTLESTVSSLLCFSPHLQVGAKFLKKSDRELPSGINILIVSIVDLNSLLQRSNIGTKMFERLKFIVFEEIECYAIKFRDDLLRLIGCARTMSTNVPTSRSIQLVLSGSKWSEDVEQLFEIVSREGSSVVCIAAVNQVIRFGKIIWNVHHVENEDSRTLKLQELFRNNDLTLEKIIVACSTADVAESVYLFLKDAGIDSQLATPTFKTSDLENKWKRRIPNVLVISDDLIRGTNITDASCLICFDSPQLQQRGDVKRSVAAERFGYMWENIRKVLKKTIDADHCKLVTHLLFTGSEENFYDMYKFTQCLNQSLVSFSNHLKTVAVQREIEGRGNDASPLCEGVKLFGFCNHLVGQEYCSSKHFFSKDDLVKVATAPVSGELEVRVVRCKGPSQYDVQLLRHFKYNSGKRVCEQSYINELKKRSKTMNEFYSNENNRVKMTCWKMGTQCAVFDPSPEFESYTRGQLSTVLTLDVRDNSPKTVRVVCQDTGSILNVSADEIFSLEPDYEQWSPLIVELILANLKPVDDEMEYLPFCNKKAKELTSDKIFNAKIELAVGNTVWVNPMVEYHLDPVNPGKIIKGMSVRLELINGKLANSNPSHMEELVKLVKHHEELYRGIEQLTISKRVQYDELHLAKQEFHQLGDDYRWASIGMSSERKIDPAEIMTTFGYDPWTFYGTHDKFSGELRHLEKDLHKYVEDSIPERFPKYDELFLDFYEEGMVVAVKEETEQTWMRALISSKYTNEDGQTLFDVFFVDYGDSAYEVSTKSMFPILNRFVARMPFQVIAFKLRHVKPKSGSLVWEHEQKEAFLDIIIPDGKSVKLDLMALEKLDNSGLRVPCRYYEVMAMHHDDELGSLLVKQSHAEFTDETGAEKMETFKEQLLNYYNAAVSQNLQFEDEDDLGNGSDEDDRFDINLPDWQVPQLLKDAFGIPVAPALSAHDKENQSSFAVELPQSQEEKTVTDGDVEPGSSSEVQAASLANSMPITTPTTKSSGVVTLHPQVVWRQTNQNVMLTIQLPDIQEYKVQLADNKQTLTFSASKPENYGFEIRLYGKVLPDIQEFLTGQYLRLTFAKRMPNVMWIRILYEKTEKYKWLREDLAYLDTSGLDDDDEEAAGGSKLKYEAKEKDGEYEYDSDLDMLADGDDSNDDNFLDSNDSDSDIELM